MPRETKAQRAAREAAEREAGQVQEAPEVASLDGAAEPSIESATPEPPERKRRRPYFSI